MTDKSLYSSAKDGLPTPIAKCVKCGVELKWGDFAHNQDTCYHCFKDIVLQILSTLQGEEREVVVWMMALVAEKYGYEW